MLVAMLTAAGTSETHARGRRRERCGARVGGAALLLLLAVVCGPAAFGQYAQPPQGGMAGSVPPAVLKDIRIEQKLGAQLPLDAQFRDEAGQAVRLGDYFGRRPVIVALVYYNCPMLCNQVLNGLTGSLRTINFDAGRDFDVVLVSFDPREGPQDARIKKNTLLRSYTRANAEAGWHFLTGDKPAIDAVAAAVGFHYAFDETTSQFAHASGIMVATPQGRLSHYFYGIEYPPRDVRFGLVEASGGKIGSPVDQLVLYCYHYDPTTGKYGPVIMNIMRLAGLVTVLGVVALILIMRRAGAAPDRAAAAGGTA